MLNKIIIKNFLFGITCFISTSFIDVDTPKQIVQRTIESINHLKTSSFHLKSTERLISSKPSSFNYFVKKRKDPLAIYAKVLENGQEVLYDVKKNPKTALVNPNSFPYINLTLDINGSLMRKDQHHSCADFGFEAFAHILKSSIERHANEFYKYLTIQGEVEYLNRRCFKLVIDFKDYAITEYKCKKGDNLFKIASQLLVNEYKLLMLNPNVSDYQDIKEGQLIKVPNAYGKQIVFYVDKATWLPVYQKVMDEVGLYELYEFDKVQINPAFSDIDFSSNNKAYGF